MTPRTVRILWVSALAIVVASTWLRPLESAATQQVDAGLNRALLSFGTARALGAVISVAQGTGISVQPFGIGVNFAPGQALRPINELLGQFAELMLAASVIFGVAKILIGIGSNWVVSLFLSAFAAGWAWYRWRGREAPFWFSRVLLVLLLVRFAVPVVIVGSDAVFQNFMARDYLAHQQAIEGKEGEWSTLAPPAGDVNTGGGIADRIKSWSSQNLDLRVQLERLKGAASRITEHVVKLIVIFVMQTLVIPLVLFWALYRAGRAVFAVPPWHGPRVVD